MKLRLGYSPVELKVLPRAELSPGSDGDHTGGLIQLADDIEPLEQVRVFFHEFGHEVLQRLEVHLGDALEEIVVQGYAMQLTELLVRNPRFREWLEERVRGRS